MAIGGGVSHRLKQQNCRQNVREQQWFSLSRRRHDTSSWEIPTGTQPPGGLFLITWPCLSCAVFFVHKWNPLGVMVDEKRFSLGKHIRDFRSFYAIHVRICWMYYLTEYHWCVSYAVCVCPPHLLMNLYCSLCVWCRLFIPKGIHLLIMYKKNMTWVEMKPLHGAQPIYVMIIKLQNVLMFRDNVA